MALSNRILVPTDGSDAARGALQAAIELARAGGGRIRLMHALDELAYLSNHQDVHRIVEQARVQARQVLDAGLQACQQAGVTADQRLVEQPGTRFGEAVAAEAGDWEADLVVIGSHGRRGLGRLLLGSGAEQVIRLAPCPVLVVRAPKA